MFHVNHFSIARRHCRLSSIVNFIWFWQLALLLKDVWLKVIDRILKSWDARDWLDYSLKERADLTYNLSLFTCWFVSRESIIRSEYFYALPDQKFVFKKSISLVCKDSRNAQFLKSKISNDKSLNNQTWVQTFCRYVTKETQPL